MTGTIDTPPFLPMEAKTADALPMGEGWQFEPKWDGFRCLAVGRGREVNLFAKSGKILHRYFPEVQRNMAAITEDSFVMDGELVIAWEGGVSFEALQMRLHPAESRIRKLSAEIPAIFVAFDLPRLDDRDLSSEPLTIRRKLLEALLAKPVQGVKLSPYTRDRAEAQRWLDNAGGSLDGVIAKRADGGYLPEQRAML
jgi:ATP-dependent DNA ligase